MKYHGILGVQKSGNPADLDTSETETAKQKTTKKEHVTKGDEKLTAGWIQKI